MINGLSRIKDRYFNDLKYIAFHLEGAQQKSEKDTELGDKLSPLSELLECFPLVRCCILLPNANNWDIQLSRT